jgi:large subunit ribosomal protein L4
VKGNSGSKRYHAPDSPYYSRTRAEVWFTSPDVAEAAGFSRGGRRRPAAPSTD